MRLNKNTAAWIVRGLFLLTILLPFATYSLRKKEFDWDQKIERDYDRIVNFQKLHRAIGDQSIPAGKLQTMLGELKSLSEGDFILKSEAMFDIARLYDKSGRSDEALSACRKIVADTDSAKSRADALMLMARIYERIGDAKNALFVLQNCAIYQDAYRADERNCELMRLNYRNEDYASAGKYVFRIKSLPGDYQAIYSDTIRLNWKNYTADDKLQAISRLKLFLMNGDYTRFALKYIEETQPSAEDVERMTFESVYRMSDKSAMSFVEALKAYSNYAPVAEEMKELNYLYYRYSPGADGNSTGREYCSQLNGYGKLEQYNPQAVAKIYTKYLSNDMEPYYAMKSLEVVVRNLLAVRDYAKIAELIDGTYVKLGIPFDRGILSQYASFWNGYCNFKLGNYGRSLMELENTITICPDDYYAGIAKDLIVKILEAKGMTPTDYLLLLSNRYHDSPGIVSRVYYSKLLYVFDSDYARENHRKRLMDLLSKTSQFFTIENKTKLELTEDDQMKLYVFTKFGFDTEARRLMTQEEVEYFRQQDYFLSQYGAELEKRISTYQIVESVDDNLYINDNYTFLPIELKTHFYPQVYRKEIELALSRISNASLTPALTMAVMRTESSFNPKCHSGAGAQGLMQMMPATAKLISPKIFGTTDINLYDPLNSILLGTCFLNFNLDGYDFVTALQVYNAGHVIVGRVKNRYPGLTAIEAAEVMPYFETRMYVRKVIRHFSRYSELYDSNAKKDFVLESIGLIES